MSDLGPSWTHLVPLWSHPLGPTQVYMSLLLTNKNVYLVPLANICRHAQGLLHGCFLSCSRVVFSSAYRSTHTLCSASGTRGAFVRRKVMSEQELSSSHPLGPDWDHLGGVGTKTPDLTDDSNARAWQLASRRSFAGFGCCAYLNSSDLRSEAFGAHLLCSSSNATTVILVSVVAHTDTAL